MAPDAPDTRPDALRNLQQTTLPLALLLFSTVIAAATDDPSTGTLVAELAVAASAAGWIVLGALTPRRTTREPTRRHVGFFVVLVVLMAVLVALSPVYGFFSWTGYLFVPDAFSWSGHRFAPRSGLRWRFLLGVAPVAAISAYSQTGATGTDSLGDAVVWAALTVVNFTIAGAFMWFAWASRAQDERRREALEDLTVAHRELERSSAENAALQARVIEQAREAGVQHERGRMAREIHDTLAQGLVGIITQLEAAGQAADHGGDWRAHHETAAAMAREGLSEARRSVDALRPEALESAKLPDAVAGVAREWSARHGVEVEVAVTGQPRPLRPELDVALLRAAQEALANVARHASAGRVGLTLSYMGDEVALDVRDDGVGFDAAARATTARRSGLDGGGDRTGEDGPADAAPGRGAPRTVVAGGYGLTAMRERVAELHGTLEIESEPGAGVALSARVPVDPPGAATAPVVHRTGAAGPSAVDPPGATADQPRARA